VYISGQVWSVHHSTILLYYYNNLMMKVLTVALLLVCVGIACTASLPQRGAAQGHEAPNQNNLLQELLQGLKGVDNARAEFFGNTCAGAGLSAGCCTSSCFIGVCWCDNLCHTYGDCCVDVGSYTGCPTGELTGS